MANALSLEIDDVVIVSGNLLRKSIHQKVIGNIHTVCPLFSDNIPTDDRELTRLC